MHHISSCHIACVLHCCTLPIQTDQPGKNTLKRQGEFICNKRNPLFYCCSRIRFQIPVFELCKIWIKKLNNYSTTEWFSAKRHKVKHRKSWKLLNWDQLQSDFPSLWMGISSWEVHNIIGKGQTNLPTWAKLILSQPFAQTPGRTKKRQL